jgi:hypothetical protein
MLRLGVQLPPLVRRARCWRERAARDRAEGLPRADQRQQHEDHAGDRDRVREEPGQHALLLGPGIVLVVGADRTAGRDPPTLGDVGGLVGGCGNEVAEEVEAVPVRHPPRSEQRLGVDRLAPLPGPPFASGPEHQPRASVQGDEGGQLVQRLAHLPHREQAEHPHQRAERESHHAPRQRARRRVDQQRVEGRPSLLVVDVPAGEGSTPNAAVGGLDVEDHCLRNDQGAVAGPSGPPAEVDVVAEDRHLLVEPAELLEHRAADQHAGGVDREHRSYVVVLALVVLAPLEARLAATRARDRDAELQQPAQRGPLAQLRPEDVGVRIGLRGRDQRLQGTRVGRGVVVQQPDPVGVTDLLEAEPHGLRVRRTAMCGDDRAERLGQQLRAGVTTGGVHGDHPVHRTPLGPDPVDDRRQPPGAVMADEEGDDGGRHDR